MKSFASEANIKRHSRTKASQQPATLLPELHIRGFRVTRQPILSTVIGQLRGNKGRKRGQERVQSKSYCSVKALDMVAGPTMRNHTCQSECAESLGQSRAIVRKGVDLSTPGLDKRQRRAKCKLKGPLQK